MTRRFFYTDPLAAAWQAKHFGMQFRKWSEEGVPEDSNELIDTRNPFAYSDDSCTFTAKELAEVMGRQTFKAYVHHDSLPIARTARR